MANNKTFSEDPLDIHTPRQPCRGARNWKSGTADLAEPMVNPDSRYSLQPLVASLPGHPDFGLLRAAARRGAIAILNLEAIPDVDAALTTLVHPRAGRVGVRIDSRETLDRIRRELVSAVDVVVCTAAALEHGGVEVLGGLRSATTSILLECLRVEDAAVAH